MYQTFIYTFQTFVYTPLLNALIFFYHVLGDSFGLAIIALTAVIRAVTIPLTIPAMRSQERMQKIQPEIEQLKKRYSDKAERQKAQLELLRSHGVNPGAGCLPQIVQIIILIALYQVFNQFLSGGTIDGASVNMQFLWLDLSKPDPLYALPVLAGLTQLVYSLMLRPGTEHPHPADRPVTTKEKGQEKSEMDMAQEIQSQMLFMMPLMTAFIALRFPSGLALYWVVTTVFSLIQQWIMTGPGGLRYYWTLATTKLAVSRRFLRRS